MDRQPILNFEAFKTELTEAFGGILTQSNKKETVKSNYANPWLKKCPAYQDLFDKSPHVACCICSRNNADIDALVSILDMISTLNVNLVSGYTVRQTLMQLQNDFQSAQSAEVRAEKDYQGLDQENAAYTENDELRRKGEKCNATQKIMKDLAESRK